MNWLDKLERKFGRYAIHNLMYYIIILYAVGFVFQMINPSFYLSQSGRCGDLAWTDMEDCDIYHSATIFESAVYHYCIIFLLRAGIQSREDLGRIPV